MKHYRCERVSGHIRRIVDIAGVACYLIEGSEKACLLDTCCGYGNLRTYAETLTDKEITVILTHGHYDHTGSASFFENVYMNHRDIPVLKSHTAQRRYFLEEDRNTIPSLKEITYESLNPMIETVPEPLHDGDIFNLGNLHVEMIAVPGHTPGMMCALIREERVMLYGDACGINVLLHDEFASCVSEYRKSLNHLKSFGTMYDRILRNHGSYTNGKELLDNVIACCDEILEGRDDHHPVMMYGKTLYEAKTSANGRRCDGMQGNIIYAPEKQE